MPRIGLCRSLRRKAASHVDAEVDDMSEQHQALLTTHERRDPRHCRTLVQDVQMWYEGMHGTATTQFYDLQPQIIPDLIQAHGARASGIFQASFLRNVSRNAVSAACHHDYVRCCHTRPVCQCDELMALRASIKCCHAIASHAHSTLSLLFNSSSPQYLLFMYSKRLCHRKVTPVL